MRNLWAAAIVFIALYGKATSQELYVYTEPASNMPARSMGLKFTSRFPDADTRIQRYTPEVMFGIDKHLMVHVSSSFSNYFTKDVRFESGKLYGKYRFYSNDGVHKHFRMAAFAEGSFTRNPYVFDEITLDGDNDGAQAGLIATQLINKLAISSTVAYSRLFPESGRNNHNGIHTLNTVNYSLSGGYLLFPKDYKDYKQTNVNLYLEMLGMRSLDNRHYNIDAAPAIQFIFNSNTKVNLGYRFQLSGNMYRIAERTWLIGFEHTLFNIWK